MTGHLSPHVLNEMKARWPVMTAYVNVMADWYESRAFWMLVRLESIPPGHDRD
jgi:hypothetical protein